MPGKVKINGRPYWFQHISAVTRKDKHIYEVSTPARGTFTVEGGRHAGSTRRDWFVDSPLWSGSISCTSLVDACRLIDGM